MTIAETRFVDPCNDLRHKFGVNSELKLVQVFENEQYFVGLQRFSFTHFLHDVVEVSNEDLNAQLHELVTALMKIIELSANGGRAEFKREWS